jgi:DNA methyltransferase 1-associated protein 1
MASSADVREIMGLAPGNQSDVITKEMILGPEKTKKFYNKKAEGLKRPEGMARELYNLLYNDSKDAPPIIPTDSTIGKGFNSSSFEIDLELMADLRFLRILSET